VGRLTIASLVVVAVALAPRVAGACAVCVDSAWGNRGFGWPFVALMLAPFVIAAGLGGVLAWSRRRRPLDDHPDVSG
jgi:hypothetical protein